MEENVIELIDASIYHTRGGTKRLRRNNKRLAGSELVLREVNLTVKPGEFVYLIGKVGTGKSTLLKTIYGEVPLALGEGYVAGFSLHDLRRKEIPYLRRRIGIIFQDYKLLTDRDVYANLYYVMRATGWKNEEQIRRRINEVLLMVNLKYKEHKMPYELSGGQQQRLAVGRALINQPAVLLADEPTGNLDPAAAADVMELFHKIVASGCSVLMSTHNISILEENPSRTLRLLNGKVEELDLRSIFGLE